MPNQDSKLPKIPLLSRLFRGALSTKIFERDVYTYEPEIHIALRNLLTKSLDKENLKNPDQTISYEEFIAQAQKIGQESAKYIVDLAEEIFQETLHNGNEIVSDPQILQKACEENIPIHPDVDLSERSFYTHFSQNGEVFSVQTSFCEIPTNQ